MEPNLKALEFLLLRNRGFGPLAVTVLLFRLPGGRRYRLRRRVTGSAPFSSLVTGRVFRPWYALRTAGLSEIARVAGFSCPRS